MAASPNTAPAGTYGSRRSGSRSTGSAALTELNQLAVSASYKKDIGNVPVQMKNDRVELEMKIIQIRLQARKANDITRKRLDALAAVLEQKLREMDRKDRHGLLGRPPS